MSNETNAWLQLLLNEAVRVLAPIVIVFLVALLAQGIRWLQGRLGAQRWTAIEDAVRFAVLAAEQSGLADKARASGLAKKELALDLAEQFLKARNITLDLEKLSALIEASVYENFNLDWQTIKTEPTA